MDNIVLLSDHTWFYVEDKEQARAFVQHHNWEKSFTIFQYGLYISTEQPIIIPYMEREENE